MDIACFFVGADKIPFAYHPFYPHPLAGCQTLYHIRMLVWAAPQRRIVIQYIGAPLPPSCTKM